MLAHLLRAMFMSVRASEIRTIPISGNGIAASIRDQSRANISPTPPRPSTKARADFEHAWQVFQSKRTEADFR
jgi:hypothetical protein